MECAPAECGEYADDLIVHVRRAHWLREPEYVARHGPMPNRPWTRQAILRALERLRDGGGRPTTNAVKRLHPACHMP